MLGSLAALLAGVAGFPLVILTVETLAGLRRPKAPALNGPAPRTTVIIPAHNEEGGIAATVAAIKPSGVDILVVADNCTDATTKRARAAGADVVERHDASARGKGYALAFGREALRDDPPEVVIILDADCAPDGDALSRLTRHAAHTGRAVQARNELQTSADDPPMTRISNFAFSLKNVVRQRGMMRIAGTCVLTGTGMAFPWDQFREAPLATADSVEDLAIGLALVRRGHAPVYLEDARVTSPAASGSAAVTQRTRWEHGFIATASRVAPRMIGHGIARLDWRAFWLGLHLMVPPLALTFALAVCVLAIAIGLGLFSTLMPALVLGTIIACAGLSVLGGWAQVGRAALPFAMLIRVPLYIAWKLPIYLKLTRGADRRWTRTERD
jgi:cellulose synthase/poly-beta-1,6-N-acetylglucosamine synthase-like glycosyltransferase